MAKVTVEVSDVLLEQLESAGCSIAKILPEALMQYLTTLSTVKDITQTQTWKLCGSFVTVSEPTDGLDRLQGAIATNDAEQIDEVLYNGL
ncbi:MAG: hypothetical protein KME35_16885 [Aphanocapsa sp. GSE-SYN-MK-11-07L]|jgi:hypothetical protein|nr:hypothetical protein [Aphanocapsa sp. GSE-SYN-MK-11-07L]